MLGLTVGSEISITVKAIMQALATGTFFHVIFVGMLPSEMGNLEHRLPNVACMVAGFVLIAAAIFMSIHAGAEARL